jgi:hypothetical protein
MRTIIKISFSLCIALAVVQLNGMPLEIAFESGIVKISSVKTMQGADIRTFDHSGNPLYQLFYTYYFPEGLDEYKDIFYDENYPASIDENFSIWQQNMQGVTITIESVVNAFYQSKTTSIINFSYRKGATTLRLSFFAKQIKGRWYPYEAAELMEMNDLRYFFPIINQGVLLALLNKEAANPETHIANEIMAACGAGSPGLSAHCFYVKAEEWGISDDPVVSAKSGLLFLRRISDTRLNRQPVSAHVIRSVFPEASIPENEQKVISYYLNKGETMIAYQRLQMYAPGLQFTEINERMQPLLGESALRIEKGDNKETH